MLLSIRIGFLSIAMLLFSNMAIAQLQESDSARWQIQATLSGRFNSGNISRFIIIPEIQLTHISANKKWGFSMAERYTYGTFSKRKTENDVLSRNFIYLFPQRRVYPFAMLWMNTHQGQLLRFRYQAGLGVTFVPLKYAKHTVKISLTASYEQNWYKRNGILNIYDLHTDRYNTFRATVRLAGNHVFAKDIIQLYYEVYFQPSLQQRKNLRLFAEGGMNLKVYKGLGVRTFINYELQMARIETVKSADLIFNFGLNYKWAKQHKDNE